MSASARTKLSEVPFAELDIVRLRSMLYTDDGSIPAGSIGTIVFRHDRGAAFEVEFVKPFAVVATLRPADLAPAV
ncbi:DUF4926 domain-containing protein [Sphingomonas sp.]|uniref:DUF4926 domain-containing protein n=1 Tax=Sphingomonas sp. TaxID=28214 RepID=UPI00333E3ED7